MLGIGGVGRTGQEFNQRKNRKGAFWEDRYHATAVEGDFHLIRCMVYIDLNMVRAGVVVHPSEWLFSGYNDIQIPRKRYSLIDYEILMELLNIRNMEELKKSYRGWVEEELVKEDWGRQPRWTESVAVGSERFVENTKEKLGTRAMGRQIIRRNGSYDLREFKTPYDAGFRPKNIDLGSENTYYWDVSD